MIIMEKALVLIKPDGVERALIGKVISKFEDTGLKVVALKMLKPTSETVSKHYIYDEKWLLALGTKAKSSAKEKGIELPETEIQIGERVRNQLMRELSRSPIVAMVFEGNACNEIARKLAGATEPRKADPSTIRGMYSSDTYALADKNDRSGRNVVHVSENAEQAEREIKVWFEEKEINDYKRADEDVMYGK